MNKHDVPCIIDVDINGHGCRIDSWLTSQQSEFSRNHWIELIRQGHVLLNGAVCLPKTKLKAGDLVTLNPSCFRSTYIVDNKPQKIHFDVIYEDDDLLVIDKPAGLVVHPGAGNMDNTLLNGLLALHQDASSLPRAGIVHRLDKDTTGIMVIAKTLAAYNSLVKQMQNRHIKREYIALVYGHIVSGGRIETQFGRHPKNRVKMAVLPSGKLAVTHYKVTERYQHFTLLDIKLDTGRTHQIRVHMAHIGHPIVGDALYGHRIKLPPNPTDSLKNHLHNFNRQALHAYRLTIKHPSNQQILTWMASIPDDLKSLITAIEAYENHDQA